MELIVKSFSQLSADELFDILSLRAKVFVVEQKCAYQDPDEHDKAALHVWLSDEGEIKAYLRILPAGAVYGSVTIGRVISDERGCGLGKKLMAEGVRIAREKFGAEKIVVAAQVYAKGFYEKCGFRQVSDAFDEDGIPHIMMEKV